MKNFILILSFLIITSETTAVNGSLRYNGEQEILNVWGNNYEMGFAQGYLLNKRIVNVFSKSFFEIINLSYLEYEYIHSSYKYYFTVPKKYRREAEGIIDGILAAGEDVYISELHRDMDVNDILIANSILDLYYVFSSELTLGCSSLSAWGKVTTNDTLIKGNIILGRNLDLPFHISDVERGLIMTYQPDSGKSWVGFGYPSIISTISGVNEDMLILTINVGYHYNTPNTTPRMIPIQFIQREILEVSDFNRDNKVNFRDPYEKVLQVNNAGAWLMHTVIPYVDSSRISAAVLECVNESGDTFRTSENDENLYPWYLLALNHEEVNYEPISDSRYYTVLDSLQIDSNITFNRIQNIMKAVACENTLQTMFFLPNDSLFAISFADSIHDASYFSPVWYKWDDLFPNHQPVEEILGPANKLLFLSDLQRLVYTEEISIYSLNGRKTAITDINKLPSGFFIVKVHSSGKSYKLLIIK
jgi:hypothetical protein